MNFALKKDFVVHMKGVVLISGTSSGIGHHAAFTLAGLGYNVFCSVRNEKSVQKLKLEAKEKGLENEIIPIILDVTNYTQVVSGVKEVTTYLSTTGLPMVAIVNNAGFSASVPLELEFLEHVQKMFDVNFFGSVILTQEFLPLIRRDKGRIVFVGSLGGNFPTAGRVTYASTKRAIDAIVDTLRLEVQPYGVSISNLCAAYIKTSIAENSNTVIPEDRPVVAYYSYYEKELKFVADQIRMAPTPVVSSNAIVDAIRNPFPETRYFVGTIDKVNAFYIYFYRSMISDRITDSYLVIKNK